MKGKVYFDKFKSGRVTAPPSKSMAHRAILCALLCEADCKVKNICLSEDISATLSSAPLFDKKWQLGGDVIYFSKGEKSHEITIDCNESGSTFRFLLPIASALGKKVTFTGKGKLPTRPYKMLADVLTQHGASFDKTEGLPLNVCGKLKSGEYKIRGDVSSQFVTGLLFALPLLDGDSKITLTTELQSKGYVDMTVYALKSFGIEIGVEKDGYFVKGNQKYKAVDFEVEGDFSNAAFWLVLGALNGKITVENLNSESLQGDKQIVGVLEKMGANIKFQNNAVTVENSSLHGIEIDVGQIPDLAPVLSAALAFADGNGGIVNGERLKIKESDRLSAIYQNLTSAGVKARLTDDSVFVEGQKEISFCRLNGFNDHRMVMTAAVMASKSADGIEVSDITAVKKSYPDFFEKLTIFGGKCDVIDVG